jgi:exonuclease SbcC
MKKVTTLIETVELTNFQSHRHVILPMGDLTVFTGSSNSGKSSVLRALTALVRNDAVGDYITHGESFLKVKVTLDCGTAVEWVKGKNENSYRITWPDGRESFFQKVGADVPDEVKAVLKLSPIVMEGGQKAQVNIHEQLEAPFLIQDTPGHVAKVFGELTSASKLYTAVSEGIKKINRDKATKKVRKGDLEDLETQLESYQLLEQQIDLAENARIKLNVAKDIEIQAKNAQAAATEVGIIASQIYTAGERIAELQPILAVDFEPIDAISSEIESISGLKKQWDTTQLSLAGLEKVAQALDKLSDVPDLDEIEALGQEYAALSLVSGSLTSLNSRISDAEDAVSTLNKGLSSVDKKIQKAYTHLDSCPSCGQDLTDEAKETLVSIRETISVGGK